jgi:uncharacterized membrane protein YkvA (DUF1232 family)
MADPPTNPPARPALGEQPGRAEASPRVWRELLRFLPDVGRLFVDLAKDDRVPFKAKIMAGAVATYLVTPIDVVPDFIPGGGQMDDLAIAVWGVRQLLRAAGYEVLQDLWRGSDDGFLLLMLVAGLDT